MKRNIKDLDLTAKDMSLKKIVLYAFSQELESNGHLEIYTSGPSFALYYDDVSINHNLGGSTTVYELMHNDTYELGPNTYMNSGRTREDESAAIDLVEEYYWKWIEGNKKTKDA